MSANFQDILDCLPEKPPRSRLEPYGGLITELRRRKWTYREIVDVLAEKCNVRISTSTLHDFVRAQAKEARKAARLLRTVAHTNNEKVKIVLPPAGVQKQKESRQTDDEILRQIAAVKQRSVPAPPDTSKEFQYNPDEPLRLLSSPRKPQRG